MGTGSATLTNDMMNTPKVKPMNTQTPPAIRRYPIFRSSRQSIAWNTALILFNVLRAESQVFITVLVIPARVYVAGLRPGKTLRRPEARMERATRAGAPTSRTFQSEVQPLIRECGPGEPTVDRLGDSPLWALFATGQLGKRRRRGHGKAWRQRAFYGGSYRPPTHTLRRCRC